jgi:hypothetical protein
VVKTLSTDPLAVDAWGAAAKKAEKGYARRCVAAKMNEERTPTTTTTRKRMRRILTIDNVARERDEFPTSVSLGRGLTSTDLPHQRLNGSARRGGAWSVN